MITANHPYFKSRSKGQAILELAIFGSILILLLGVLLAYGVKYGYQQQMMQFAFRKALQSAMDNDGSPYASSYLAVRDRHIPVPTDPFARGSVDTFSAAASITRSNKLDQTADKLEELSETPYDMEQDSKQVYNYTSMGFRNETGTVAELKGSERRYEEVYGQGSAWRINAAGEPLVWKTGEEVSKVKDGKAENPFTRLLTDLFRYLNRVHPEPDKNPDKEQFIIRVIDACEGNIFDYESAVRQCRLIVDETACEDSCTRGGSDDCGEVCKQYIIWPWYCDNPVQGANGEWVFPALKNVLFDKTRFRALGVQADQKQTLRTDDRLDKTEDSSSITNIDHYNANDNVTTEKKIYYLPDGEGYRPRKTQDVKTEMPYGRTKPRTWQTPW